MPQTHAELLCELTDVSESFSRLSEKLSEVASELRLSGIPPTQTFVDELAASRSHFDALRTRAIELASVLTTPQGKRQEEEVSSLSDLKALLQSLGDVQDKKAADERVQQDALNVLDCILAMVYRDDAEFQPLNDCQQKARELCAAVAALKWPDLHPEATLLAHRRHPFAELLTLVDEHDRLDDDLWLLLKHAVSESFGKSLSLAAARGRLVVPTVTSVTEATAPNGRPVDLAEPARESRERGGSNGKQPVALAAGTS